MPTVAAPQLEIYQPPRRVVLRRIVAWFIDGIIYSMAAKFFLLIGFAGYEALTGTSISQDDNVYVAIYGFLVLGMWLGMRVFFEPREISFAGKSLMGLRVEYPIPGKLTKRAFIRSSWLIVALFFHALVVASRYFYYDQWEIAFSLPYFLGFLVLITIIFNRQRLSALDLTARAVIRDR